MELPAHGAGLDPSVAFVDLPPDGQPPNFDDLVTAINLVLGDTLVRSHFRQTHLLEKEIHHNGVSKCYCGSCQADH